MDQDRTVILTTKNEGPFLLEWIVYHRLIGFTNLVIFSNDCEDGSDRLLALLSAAGLIRHYGNSEAPDGLPADPQNRAYRRAFAMNHVRQSDWVLVIDADEFLNIHAGEGRLDDLFAATGACDAISPPWRVYGNHGRIRYEDGLVMERFTRCAPADLQVSFRHYGLKTLFRPGPVHRLGIHRPFLKGGYKKPETPLTWLNGSGRDVTEHYRRQGWAASQATVGYELAQINHYMIKSNELFLMKRYRGTANSTDAERINLDYHASFNSNHTTDPSLARWVGAVRAEIARLRAAHPEIAAAHDACVAFFHDKIGALILELREKDPETVARLLLPEVAADGIRADEAWLVAARRRAAAEKTAENAAAGPEEKPPAPAPALVGAEAETERDGDGAPGGIDPEDAAPAWLADLRRSDHRRGSYHSDWHFAAHFVERSEETLIVSFDNLSSVNDRALNREGWGYGFYRAEGWSHFGVMSFAANWYRDPALFDYLGGLAASGLFARFGQVVLTGTSMGAYAAATFSSLAPGATVLAFSPQSTLDESLVPWETRFAAGRRQDWSGRYRDAAAESAAAGRVFLFFDPFFAPDLRHAQRFDGPNVRRLETWYAGHKSALFLRRADLLKPLTRAAVEGTLDEGVFYRAYRQRRALPWYLNSLSQQALARGHDRLVAGMAGQLRREKRWRLARMIEMRREEAIDST